VSCGFRGTGDRDDGLEMAVAANEGEENAHRDCLSRARGAITLSVPQAWAPPVKRSGHRLQPDHDRLRHRGSAVLSGAAA
jgi:hypothetical protein